MVDAENVQTIDLFIDNATIFTLDGERRIIEDGSIAIKGSRIIDIGKSSALKGKYYPSKIIPGKNRLVMPGLINGHSHLIELAKGLVPDDLKTRDALMLWIYPYMSKLTKEEEHAHALNFIAEMVKSGTTCFVDPGVQFLDSTIKAILQSGIRCITGRWTWDQAGPDAEKCWRGLLKKTAREALVETEETIRRYNGTGEGRIKIFATLEGVGTCSDELMLGAKEIAEKHGVCVLMHKASSIEEVAIELKATGHRPVEHMYRIGSLGSNVYLNHMVALSDEEVNMVAEKDVKVCQNPSAALKAAKGITRIGKLVELIRAGVTVALGCDSSNSSNYRDMVRAIYLAATLPKDSHMDATVMTAEKAIEMATIDGAKAILWDKEIGSIEVGKKADIIVFDTQRPEWVPIYNIVHSLVYSATGDSVQTVIVDGKILMEDRVLTTIQEEEVINEVQTMRNPILERLGMTVRTRWKVES